MLLALILLLINVAIILIFHFLFDKVHKVTYHEEYYMTPPSDLPPALITYIIKNKILTNSDLSGSLMYLVEQGYLHPIETEPYFEIVHGKDLRSLYPHQIYLIEWIRSKNGESRKWRAVVDSDAAQQKFYYNLKIAKIVGIAIGVLYIFTGLYLTFFFKDYTNLLVVVLGLVSIRFVRGINRFTKKGQELYEKSAAFKRYLKDTSDEQSEAYKKIVREDKITSEDFVSYRIAFKQKESDLAIKIKKISTHSNVLSKPMEK